MVSFKCCVQTYPPNNLDEGVSAQKLYGSAPDIDDASPLLSPALPSLISSEVEVDTVFHLPLSRLTDPCYLREHWFRESTSYPARDVAGLMTPRVQSSNASANSEGEAGGGLGGWLEIWG